MANEITPEARPAFLTSGTREGLGTLARVGPTTIVALDRACEH